MAYMQFITRPSLAERIDTIEIGSRVIPYVDVRDTELQEPLKATAEHLVAHLPAHCLGPAELRLIVLAVPQPTDTVAVELARQGIHLVVGPKSEPRSALLDRFRDVLRVVGASRRSDPSVSTPGGSGGSASESARVFSQRPPWFDEQAFNDRMRLLQQPWRDEDYWTSDS
jgi:hypothetical protein